MWNASGFCVFLQFSSILCRTLEMKWNEWCVHVREECTVQGTNSTESALNLIVLTKIILQGVFIGQPAILQMSRLFLFILIIGEARKIQNQWLNIDSTWYHTYIHYYSGTHRTLNRDWGVNVKDDTHTHRPSLQCVCLFVTVPVCVVGVYSRVIPTESFQLWKFCVCESHVCV